MSYTAGMFTAGYSQDQINSQGFRGRNIFRHVLQERLSIAWGRDYNRVKGHGLDIFRSFEVSKVFMYIHANFAAVVGRVLRAFTACSTTIQCKSYVMYMHICRLFSFSRHVYNVQLPLKVSFGLAL